LGNGDGTFAGPEDYATGGENECFPVVADFNRDRHLDVATVSCFNQTVSVLLGNGAGALALHSSYSAYSEARRIAVGDLNKDRYPDVVATDVEFNTVSVMLNDRDWLPPIPPADGQRTGRAKQGNDMAPFHHSSDRHWRGTQDGGESLPPAGRDSQLAPSVRKHDWRARSEVVALGEWEDSSQAALHESGGDTRTRQPRGVGLVQ
jgi:hypothetical protein